MFAKKEIPEKYILWNGKWKAPFGRSYVGFLKNKTTPATSPIIIKLKGLFSLQTNSTTRIFEYPWVYYATPLERGMKALDIGGGFGGFQFVLSKTGLDVTNVDPGDPEYSWNYKKDFFSKLNKIFGANVTLIQTTLDKAKLKANTFDRVFCISVLEHLTEDERKTVAQDVFKVLKPGGYFILTVDLFLDIFPFTKKKKNRWGTNMDIQKFVKQTSLDLVQGKKSELNGHPEFVAESILSNLSEYFIGATYPVLTQTLVLQKKVK